MQPADERDPGESTACDGCRLALPGGTAACQTIFEEEMARQYSDFRYARRHRMAVDAYALQHPDQYCASAKSLAAHLTGLCAAFEYPGHPSLLSMLQRWLSQRPSLQKPELPADRGALTIGDVLRAVDPQVHARTIERWARATWEAHETLHPLAREWIRMVLSQRG